MPLPACKGLTLFELLLVLTILATTAVVVLPRLGSSPRADLEAAARVVAAGFRQARSQAVTTGEPTVVLLDLERKKLLLEGKSEAAKGHRSRSLPRAVNYKLYTAQSEQTSETRAGIRFYPDGSSTGGRVTATAGQHERLVDVDWLTGAVRIFAPGVQ